MMSIEVVTPDVSRYLIADLVEAWNSHDVERVAGFYADDFSGVDVAQPAPISGLQGVRQMVSRYVRAFPDLRFEQEDLLFEDGRVVLVWIARGTHGGTLMNIPPTGRKIEVRGVSILRVADNRISAAKHIWDVAGLLRNIGLLPELRP
jgi:steroid delta-isomerase-like uncharacterized protein